MGQWMKVGEDACILISLVAAFLHMKRMRGRNSVTIQSRDQSASTRKKRKKGFLCFFLRHAFCFVLIILTVGFLMGVYMVIFGAMYLIHTALCLDVPSCVNYVVEPDALCGAYVNYQFVLPPNRNQSELDFMLSTKYTTSLIPFMSPECQVVTHKFMCSMTFQPCDETLTVPTPVLPCRSLCEAAVVAPTDPTKTCNLPVTEYSNYDCSSLPINNCNTMGFAASHEKVVHVAQVYREDNVCSEVMMAARGEENESYVFVPPPNLSMEAMEAGVLMAIRQFPIWLDTDCLTAMRKMVCAQVFMPAQVNSFGMTDITLPRLPSYSLCRDFNDMCGAFEDFVASQSFGTVSILLDCHSTYAMDTPLLAGLPKYPVSSTQFLPRLLPEVMGTTDANSFEAPTGELVVPSDCPAPLVLDTNPDAAPLAPSGCSLPCPWLMYEFESTQTRGLAVFTLSLVSMFCALTMLIYYAGSGLWKKRSKVMCLLGASCNINWIIATQSGSLQLSHEHIIMCASPGVSNGGYSLTPCTVFAYLGIFLTVAMCCWWLCVAVELFFKVVRRTPDVSLARYQTACHVFCWGMGFVCATSLASMGYLGYGGLSFCMTTLDTPPRLMWTFFYGPILSSTIIGSICVIRVIWYTFQTSNQIAPTNKPVGVGTKKKKPDMYRKPILFVLSFCVLWGTVIATKLISDAVESRSTAATVDYVECLLSSYSPVTALGNLQITSQYCGAAPGEYGASRKHVYVPPEWLLYVVEALVSGQGLLYFVIFGVDRNMFKFYAVRLGLSSPAKSSSSSNNRIHRNRGSATTSTTPLGKKKKKTAGTTSGRLGRRAEGLRDTGCSSC